MSTADGDRDAEAEGRAAEVMAATVMAAEVMAAKVAAAGAVVVVPRPMLVPGPEAAVAAKVVMAARVADAARQTAFRQPCAQVQLEREAKQTVASRVLWSLGPGHSLSLVKSPGRT